MPNNEELTNNEPEEQQESGRPDPAKFPHGQRQQPIGCWWQPEPEEQNQVFSKSGPYAAPGQPN